MTTREGSLEPPKRHPLDWVNPDFYDEPKLFQEMERVFDICHGCRRCVNLCTAFPRLFDLIDDGATGELDGVEKQESLGGRGPLLSLRYVFHDEMSLCASRIHGMLIFRI